MGPDSSFQDDGGKENCEDGLQEGAGEFMMKRSTMLPWNTPMGYNFLIRKKRGLRVQEYRNCQ